MSTEVATIIETPGAPETPPALNTQFSQQVMNVANSTLVPAHFRKPENAAIAVEIARRMNTDVFSIVQNCYIVNSKPSWSSQFIISLINRCGKFSSLRWRLEGEGDKKQCIAYAKELETGEIIESPPVTIEMARKEGWFSKAGSKWQTMPEMMLRYRSASFFGRLYLPEVLNGMFAVEELEDITKQPNVEYKNSEADDINKLFINTNDYEVIENDNNN